MELFVDSSVWIASRFETGDYADWARDILDRDKDLFTSQYIVDEVVAFCLGARELRHKPLKDRRGMASEFLKIFQNSGAVDVLPVSNIQFGEAKTIFEESALGLSITDWTNLIVMRDREITDLCSFDRGFRYAVAIPKFNRIRVLPKEEI